MCFIFDDEYETTSSLKQGSNRAKSKMLINPKTNIKQINKNNHLFVLHFWIFEPKDISIPLNELAFQLLMGW